MSKKPNNRIVAGNKPVDSTPFRKCAHHIYSTNYAANMRRHDDIVSTMGDKIHAADMSSTINIKVVIHFLAPIGTYDKNRVLARAHDLVMSLNDDFNNYSANPNTMNNFRYKSIVNQIFTSNLPKQNTYLGNTYLGYLPRAPSNITFELGQVYYYPVKSRLSLSQYDDVKDIEIEQQVIRQYISKNHAVGFSPEYFLNIWVIDMAGTSILSFSNFPWEPLDNYHGIILNRRVFFPEDYGETNFANQKTATHQVGHYLGLLHVVNQDSGSGVYGPTNINADTENAIDPATEMSIRLNAFYDPTDRTVNQKLHTDLQYNPLFMNFMDYTYDKYVSMFTENQIRKMRFMLLHYRPKLNSLVNNAKLPVPAYNPDTDTVSGVISSRSGITRQPPVIPAREPTTNPRITAQGYTYANQQPQQYVPQQAVQQQYSAPAPTQAQVNSAINKLIPNLCGNMTNPNAPASKDQIIANIQNNMPGAVAQQQTLAQKYNDAVNNFQSYMSPDGYANYALDPYTSQERFKQQALYQQVQQGANATPDPRIVASQPAAVVQQPAIIPTTAPMVNNQQIDPRMAYPYPMVDPRYLMQQQMMQAPMQNYPKPEKKEKRKKRTDPQFNQAGAEITVDDDIFINQEAVSNLMSQRPPQVAQHVPPHIAVPAPVPPVPPASSDAMQPLDLANRLANVDDQIKNIKTSLTMPNLATQKGSEQPSTLTQSAMLALQPEPKYNKFGQPATANPMMINSRGTCRTVPKPANPAVNRAPNNRFVRSKPMN